MSDTLVVDLAGDLRACCHLAAEITVRTFAAGYEVSGTLWRRDSGTETKRVRGEGATIEAAAMHCHIAMKQFLGEPL